MKRRFKRRKPAKKGKLRLMKFRGRKIKRKKRRSRHHPKRRRYF